jgi:homoserine O-acetyltransferase/O-succinyltransferase
VFVCHALTGDAHASGDGGWWESLVGPGKPVDTNRFFVISPNLLGGCKGTTGPCSEHPATGAPYGLDFPLFTMRDLVAVHRALLAHLGVERLFAAVGGSLGGMQVLQWALDFGDEIERAVCVCASSRLTAQNIAFSKVARHAILQDPDFDSGSPHGLSVSRMTAHITYLSERSMEEKFDRARRVDGAPMTMGSDFEVEHYLDHQAEIFLARFDARTYLYLSRVMDYFDAFADPNAGAATATDFLLVSFDHDWRFGTHHSARIAEELRARGVGVRHEDVASTTGHDSFLLEIPAYHDAVRGFLAT